MSRNSPQTRGRSQEVTTTRKEISVSSEYRHSGPIPDPMTLEKYEEILPGAADRILKMAENQSSHRIKMESTVIRSRSRDSLLGVISGFLLAVLTILAGAYIASKGFVWSGTVFGSAGLVGLVSVFIYGTRSARKERNNNKDK